MICIEKIYLKFDYVDRCKVLDWLHNNNLKMNFERENMVIIPGISSYTTVCLEESSSLLSSSSSIWEEIDDKSEESCDSLKSEKSTLSFCDSFNSENTSNTDKSNGFEELLSSKINALDCSLDDSF